MTRREKGYIIAELATAVFIITALLTVTSALMFMSSNQVRRSHKAFVARQIASNQLELLKQRPFDELQIADATGESFTSPLASELVGFIGTARVEPFDGNAALKKITVTVQWNEKRRTRTISLSVLRGRRTP